MYVEREHWLRWLRKKEKTAVTQHRKRKTQVIFIWNARTCSAALRTLTANSRWELHLGMNMEGGGGQHRFESRLF